MTRCLGVVFACLIAFVPAGCTARYRFAYPLKPPIKVLDPDPPRVRIAVPLATENRGWRNAGAAPILVLIPFMPLGWITHDRPETARRFLSVARFDGNPVEDIPKAIALHWSEAGVAREVFFDPSGKAEGAQFVLRATLNKVGYHGSLTTYGLSFFGSLLWFVGLPMGAHAVDLDIDLALQDRDGRVVWGGKIEERRSGAVGLYYGRERDMDGLALGLQHGLDKAAKEIVDLRAAGARWTRESGRRYYP